MNGEPEYKILSAFSPGGLMLAVNAFLGGDQRRGLAGGPFYADGQYHQAVTSRE